MTTLFKLVQSQAVALYSGVSIAASSMRVTPNPKDLDGTKLTMSDFGGVIGYATIDPGIPDYEEIVSFTGITDNGDGTATLTGLTRNLISKFPYTTAGTGKQHGASAVVVFSDNPQVWNKVGFLANDNVWTGLNEFSTFPKKTGTLTPTSTDEFATKDYVDQVAGGNATYDQNIFSGTAGEDLTADDLCYFKQSDQKWWKADADALASSIGVKLAIAQADAVTDAAVNLLGKGLAKNLAGVTANAPVFVSNTAGGMSATPGTFARFLGRGVSTTQMHFDPNNGTDVSIYGTEIYAVDSVGSDSYAITLPFAPLAYKDGMIVRFKAGFANTLAATLAVNGLTAKTIKKNYNATLADNDILAGQMVEVMYDASNDCFQMLSPVANSITAKFGGTGADGALAISSGTTTLDLGGAEVFIKNYTSISITGTAVLAFSNPHAKGTTIILKSQGAVVITSSANPCIDARGMGADGGVANENGKEANSTFNESSNGKIGVSAGATGAAGAVGHPIYKTSTLHMKAVILCPGAGGGAGISGGANDYGPGGKGGGALLIECGGALNFTGTISTSGLAGGVGVQSQNPGGGGGAAGTCYIVYNTLTANTGTIDASGGAGGAGASGGTNANNRGGGGAGSPFFAGGAGGIGDAVGGNAAGVGAGGGGGGTNSRAGGTGGASMGGYVVPNLNYI